LGPTSKRRGGEGRGQEGGERREESVPIVPVLRNDHWLDPQTPYSWWCLLPLPKNPNLLSAFGLDFGPSGLRQPLPTVLIISPNKGTC